MKRKLIKFSNYSFCITLPKKAVEKLGWDKGEEVDVTFDPRTKKIIVTKGGDNEGSADKSNKSQIKVKTKKEKVAEGDEIQPIPKLRW